MLLSSEIEKIKNKYQNFANKKIYVGMSGGVDSSTLAILLHEVGFNVTGFYLECWDPNASYCKSDQDYADALKVASKYNFKLLKIDFKEQYRDLVLKPFIEAYKKGIVPNPDVMCNQNIKFGEVYSALSDLDDDFVLATGHYAKISYYNSIPTISMADDVTKDQSYFLYRIIGKSLLNKAMLPLGDYSKAQVRELAEALDLHNASKPDSQGLCFIGDVKMQDFLSEYIDTKAGEVKLLNGEVVGEHNGAHLFAIGQRHGFTTNKYFSEPMYVIKKDSATNTLYIGNRNDAFSDTFCLNDLVSLPNFDFNQFDSKSLKVRIRNLGDLYPVNLIENDFGQSEKLIVKTADPIFGISEGQSGVFYLGDQILFGGIIGS